MTRDKVKNPSLNNSRTILETLDIFFKTLFSKPMDMISGKSHDDCFLIYGEYAQKRLEIVDDFAFFLYRSSQFNNHVYRFDF